MWSYPNVHCAGLNVADNCSSMASIHDKSESTQHKVTHSGRGSSAHLLIHTLSTHAISVLIIVSIVPGNSAIYCV